MDRGLYCSIMLRRDYKAQKLDIVMPGYIKKQLLKYEHIIKRVQHCPYSPEPKKYDAKAQSPLPQDNSRKLTNKEIKQLQKIVGSILLCKSGRYDHFNGVEFDCQ